MQQQLIEVVPSKDGPLIIGALGGYKLDEWAAAFWMVMLAFALAGVNAFSVAVQMSLAKARTGMPNRGEARNEGSLRSRLAATMAANQERFMTLCQLGVSFSCLGIGLGAAWIAGKVLAPWLGSFDRVTEVWIMPLAYTGAFVMALFLLLAAAGLALKLAELRRPEAVLRFAAFPMYVAMKLLSPIVTLLLYLNNGLLRVFGLSGPHGAKTAQAEVNLRSMLEEGRRSGFTEGAELAAMMDNIFSFNEKTAREIMIPRTEMICLKAGLSLKANKAIAIQYMRTRYPVCENDKDNIIGFVHIKDLLKDNVQPTDSMKAMIRPVTTVPEGMPISSLMGMMQKTRSQIAILIDEFGGTSGLVTLEDIMEEIVGDIQDEFDSGLPDIVKMDNGHYSISGLMLIEEVNSFFGLSIPSDEFETIGGWLYHQLPSPPMPMQSFILQRNFQFQILETKHLRISRIAVAKQDNDAPQDKPILHGNAAWQENISMQKIAEQPGNKQKRPTRTISRSQ
jgi:CBS domain containing-hemolysin-like protein